MEGVRAGVVVPNSDVVEVLAVGALNAEGWREKPEVGAAMPVGSLNNEDAAKGVDEGLPKREEKLDADGVGAAVDPKEKPEEGLGLSAEGAPKRDERFDVDGVGAAEEDPREKPLEAAGAGAFAAAEDDTEIEIEEAVDPDV